MQTSPGGATNNPLTMSIRDTASTRAAQSDDDHHVAERRLEADWEGFMSSHGVTCGLAAGRFEAGDAENPRRNRAEYGQT